MVAPTRPTTHRLARYARACAVILRRLVHGLRADDWGDDEHEADRLAGVLADAAAVCDEVEPTQ